MGGQMGGPMMGSPMMGPMGTPTMARPMTGTMAPGMGGPGAVTMMGPPSMAGPGMSGMMQQQPGEMKATISLADAKTEAEKCRRAMKGMSTNDKVLIEILGNKTPADIQLIKKAYHETCLRDFMKDVHDDTSGHFREALLSLCSDPAELDAKLIHQGCRGLAADVDLLSEVICTRSQAELKAASDAYTKQYSRNMEKDIKEGTSGELMRIYLACITETMRARACDVNQDVEALHKAASGFFGADHGPFLSILTHSPRSHLDIVYATYAQKYGKALDKVIASGFHGDVGVALSTLVSPLKVYFAEKILRSMKGLGTRDHDLIRLLTTQRGRSLRAAGKYFLEVNRKTIGSWVADETSGDYKLLMLKICETEGI